MPEIPSAESSSCGHPAAILSSLNPIVEDPRAKLADRNVTAKAYRLEQEVIERRELQARLLDNEERLRVAPIPRGSAHGGSISLPASSNARCNARRISACSRIRVSITSNEHEVVSSRGPRRDAGKSSPGAD